MNASRSRTRLLPWSAAVALICSISLFTGAAAADTLVYSNDFESPVGAEWSNQLMSATPAGHGFLGRFAWDAVTLSLDDMAAHASVTLQFDLYIISSWDGNVEFSGPDIWGVEVVDGPRLMRTSFARWDIDTGNTRPPFATDSLGYGGWGDDVYRYTFTFPHSASTLDLRFYGDNIQDVGDESWGLDTVQVWTADTVADPATPPPAPPTNVRAIPGNRVVDVMWDAATNVGSGLDRVIVIRNPPPANSRDFHYVAPGATATEVKAISTDGTPHAYRILVVDTAGNVAMSEWSNSVVPFWEPLPGVNQLTNGDFESGELAPWGEHGGADRVIDTTNPYEGAASLYIRSHGVGWVYQESGVHYVLPEFRGGQEYTFSAFMRADEPRRVNMRAYREGGHWNARGERHQDVDTEWREYYVTFTPESDVVPTRLAINAAESTVGFWVDNVQFYEGSYQPAGENPVLSIVEPAVHYAILDGNSATVEVGVHNHTGAWHWQLDAPFPESGPAGGVGVSNGRTALLTGLAPGVAHTFYAALVDGNGDVLQPSVLASTQLSVPGATPHVLDDEPKVNEGGYIASWLHLDQPIMTHVDATRALTRNTVGAETILLPIEGAAVPQGIDNLARTWQRINFSDTAEMEGQPPFQHYWLGMGVWQHRDLSSDFLVTYLRWDTTRVVDFSFAADDTGEAYFNGNRIYWSPNGNTASVRVVAGEWNVLVVGTHESGGAWHFWAHVNPTPDAVENTGANAHLVGLGTPVELVAPQRVAPGSVFPVSVRIAADVSSLDAASVELSIGPDANLEFDHIEVDGTLFDGAGVTVNAIDATQITFVVNQSSGAGVSGPGEIARVYFRAVGPADAVGSVAMASATLSSVQAERIRSHVASGTSVVSMSCEPGDSNGDQIVDVVDITKIERIVAGLDPAPIDACPDANLDGVTNVLDVTSTERIVVGLPAVASAPMAARVPAVTIRPLRPADGYGFDLVLERSMEAVDTVYLELLYSKDAYFAAEIETFALPSDAALLTNSEPGRTRHVRNVRGLSGVTLSELVARVHLRETTPGDAPPVTLRVLIGDTSGRALVIRDFHIPMMRVPTVTTALPNFPNPFNPETWIPFDLAESSDVVIRVYGVGGELVRTLDLGGLPAGSYADRSRAAYWDGRNESGEPVAGGVYHYEIRAGAYRATRRMVILK